MIKFCSYFVEHRETSELGSGFILARPSYPIHLLAVSQIQERGEYSGGVEKILIQDLLVSFAKTFMIVKNT